jgi:hypothetical protein
VGLGAGILLQVIASWRLSWSAWISHACGWPLILAGLWLAAWGVRTSSTERSDEQAPALHQDEPGRAQRRLISSQPGGGPGSGLGDGMCYQITRLTPPSITIVCPVM